MPMTPELRQKVDRIRDDLYGGGYPDPVTNAEQLSFLFFFYLIEGIDRQNAARARVLKIEHSGLFEGAWELRNPMNALEHGQTTIPAERFKWSLWARGLSGENLVRFVRDEVFPFFTALAQNSAVNFMDGARLGIDDPSVLSKVVTDVDALRLDEADADTKGDLFEHVLRQIKQAGELGQFRTPRHIIRAIVDIVAPEIGESVYDPAAGTGGFLTAAYNFIRLANSSSNAIETVEADGKPQRRGLGDRLSQKQQALLSDRTFYGNDVDPKMVRLATMNLTLRGLPNVHILRRNVLTSTLDSQQREDLGLPDSYDVVLANPPFSGRVDKDRIVDDVKVGNTSSTEILFIKYMLDALKPGGRCGVIVPEGVLFGSTGAHRELRRILLEQNTVQAIMSFPGGVFQPYSGVKTSAVFFRKGGSTKHVMFLHVDSDGYKLDANHDQPTDKDDLPGLIAAYRLREECLEIWGAREGDWRERWWFADIDQLRANDSNLSANLYRPRSNKEVAHRDPVELLDDLAAIEAEIFSEVEALRAAVVEDLT
jgi:type I restriction enzyme M protein